MSTPQWTAGAHSVEALEGDGYFRFLVPVGSVGVSVGFSAADSSPDPMEPSHGFLFESGRFRLFADGRHLTDWAEYSGTAFYIGREGGRVYFASGSPDAYAPDNILFEDLPGGSATVASSSIGPVFLDAALLMPGDSIRDAELFLGERPPASSRVVVAFSPMLVSADAFSELYAAGEISFLPAEIAAVSEHSSASVDTSFSPMQVSAVDGEFNSADVSFSPATVDAQQWPIPSTVAIAIPAMAVSAREYENMARADLPAMGVSAHEVSAHWAITLPAFQAGVPPIADVDDVAIASDATYPSHYAMVTDTVLAGDEVTAGAVSVNDLEDTALAGDGVTLGVSVLLEDGALAGDDLLATASTILLQDGAWAGDELLAYSTGTALVEDGAWASDAALPYAFADVTSEALAGDEVLIATVDLLDDAAIADDEVLITALRGTALLEDGAVAGDDLLARSDSFALLQDGAIASEQLFMKTPGLVAWVMNTDTGAVSWYDNWAFTSIAVVGGKVFAAGPDGLHVLGGDLDGAEQIDARVQFGYTELGGYDNTGHPKPSDQKKRLSGLWFGYHAGGELAATVETYGQGYDPHTYAMAARAAEQPRNNRIVPGKGLNARYWRIGVANTDGCAFEVHSIAAEVAQSTRRI